LTKNPTDIDLTCAEDPQKIFQNLSKVKEYSVFKTEKYGTVTFLPKKEKNLQYECTPLRTETAYDDHRHPKEITRSESIVEDSLRRDFTINALYYFGV
jgi:tRNA nucleotidyltransferase (CCA-adding enzyme)